MRGRQPKFRSTDSRKEQMAKTSISSRNKKQSKRARERALTIPAAEERKTGQLLINSFPFSHSTEANLDVFLER